MFYLMVFGINWTIWLFLTAFHITNLYLTFDFKDEIAQMNLEFVRANLDVFLWTALYFFTMSTSQMSCGCAFELGMLQNLMWVCFKFETFPIVIKKNENQNLWCTYSMDVRKVLESPQNSMWLGFWVTLMIPTSIPPTNVHLALMLGKLVGRLQKNRYK